MQARGLSWVGLGLALAACGDDSSGNGATTTDGATTSGSPTSTSTASGGSGGFEPAGGGGLGGVGGAGGTAGAAASVWHPGVGVTWQWQLSDYPIDTTLDVQVYDVDLFEAEDEELEALFDAGRHVICYFSAGSYEPYRPDAASFPESVKGAPLDPPFSDELWLDLTNPALEPIMLARLDLAARRGCSAVEPDNVDAYQNDSGFALTADDQLAYNQFLADAAHERGLSVGLKNDVDQLGDLVASFDWALNEECFTYDECDAYEDNFLAAGKAVFHAEYTAEDTLAEVCAVTAPLGLSTILKNLELDAWQVACP